MIKHKHHHKNYRSLKVKIYDIERMLDKMSRRMQRSCECKAKALFKGLGGWWATIKENVMPAKKRGGKKAGSSKGSMRKTNKNKTSKPKNIYGRRG